MTPTVWERSRPVPPDFQAALAAAFPPVERLAWLYVRWEPGDPWAPVQRWTVWDVHPWHLVPAEDQAVVRPALEGPDPRGTGHYCAAGYCECALKKNRWTGGVLESVDFFAQWCVAQELKAMGRPGFPRLVWIVQGEQGGHPPQMDAIERQMARVAGLPTEYPAAGEAPYAPLDQRVICGLVAHDRLRDAHGMLGAMRSADMQDAAYRDRAQAAADAVFEFIAGRVHQSAEEWAFWERKATGHLITAPHGTPEAWTDRDEFKRRFIEDTAIVPVSL